MATKIRNHHAVATIMEANRQLSLAVSECRALLERTEKMIRRSQQDNDPPKS